MPFTYVKAPPAANPSTDFKAPAGTCAVDISLQGAPQVQKKVCLSGAFRLVAASRAVYNVTGYLKTLSADVTTDTNTSGAHGAGDDTKWQFREEGMASLNKLDDIASKTVTIGSKQYKNVVHTGGSITTESLQNNRKILRLGYKYTVFGE